MKSEQASGEAEVDGRSDQFSLGLILHEMIMGKKAFERPTAAETMAAIIRDDPAPLEASVQGPFRGIIERCLAKEPAQRYEATRDLFLELRYWRDHASEITAVMSAPPVPAKSRPRLIPAALAGGIAAGFVLALLWLRAPLASPRYTPFATEAGIQTTPAWSPKGDQIAYASEVDGIFQIFTRKLGSSTPTQVTRQNASCFLPFWTADGTRIYYVVHQSEESSLWSKSLAGGDAEKILDGAARAVLSPDGKTLVAAIAQPDHTYALMLSSPPGATPRPFPQVLIAGMRSAFDFQYVFQFTEDGRYLGLLTDARAKTEFWKIPMDGGSPQELLPGRELGEFNQTFNWLPDGNLVWSSNSSGDGHLMLTDVGRATDRELTPGVSRERHLALSPDGQTLAFQAGEIGYDLAEIPLDGSPGKTVLATDRDEVAPSWAPDGVHFAYSTNRSGPGEIWLRDLRDGSERLVVSTHDLPEPNDSVDSFLDCTISPDGLRVAYRRMHGASVEIWISALAGGTPVRLYDDPHHVMQRGPAWSPDGNWIAYYSTYQGKPAVMKNRVGANHEPELVAYATALNPVRWSSRGDWIAWNDGRKLVLVSPDGKQRRTISQREWLTYGWSKEGDSLYGIGLTENHHLVVGRVAIEPAKETVVADLGLRPASLEIADFQGDFPYRGFSLRPDGKAFLTSVLAMKGDIWLMQDFNRRIGWVDRLRRKP